MGFVRCFGFLTDDHACKRGAESPDGDVRSLMYNVRFSILQRFIVLYQLVVYYPKP